MEGNVVINSKTLSKLQYDDILAMVSKYAISSIAMQRTLDILPCDNFDNAKVLLAEVSQARQLFDYSSSFDLSIDDVTLISEQSRVGSVLSMAQLLCVMRQLRTARLLQNQLLEPINNIDTTLLMSKASLLYTNKALEDDIDFAIISDDEMNDKASTELYNIRKKIKSINSDIKSKLASYSRQGELSKYLQDSIVTIRSDRYVVPVKQEYKSFVNGIVHDVSASGSTIFVEPMAVVQLNNQLHTALSEEREEINRILEAFTNRIGMFSAKLLTNQDIISELDVIFAKVKFAMATKSTMPSLNNDGYVDIRKARHPLLDSHKVVPINATLGREYDIVVVTGPNTGGKTVSLKTIGLMCLMGMSGMFVPCQEGSTVSFFDDIFCDIGDEQSIEQNLSTFSSHIVNISNILQNCNSRSLVLIDEAGAGTEPNEGTALALAITEKLRISGAKSVITTHYGQLKEYALNTAGVENACMEFDPETFAPTYKLVVGVAGSSNAIAIAKRLGMPSDVIQYAKDNVSAESQHFEQILLNAEMLRQRYEQQAEEIEVEKLQLAQELEKANKLKDNLTRERDKLLANSRAEAKQIVVDAQLQAKNIIAQLKQLSVQQDIQDKTVFEARAIAKQLNSIHIHEDNDDGDEVTFWGDNVPFENIHVGDKYYCRTLSTVVEITAIKNRDKISARAGILSTIVPCTTLHYSKTESKTNNKQKIKTRHTVNNRKQPVAVRSTANEINCLGQTVDEAVVNIDNFIDQCIRNSFATVWIIHGMGTGRLRAGIHQHLRSHANVLEYRLGKYGEGESGVTVVTLK